MYFNVFGDQRKFLFFVIILAANLTVFTSMPYILFSV